MRFLEPRWRHWRAWAATSQASTKFLFEGSSHCIWHFQGNMSGPAKAGNASVPIVIDYAIADGRNDVLWTVSYDCSKLADGDVSWDSRGPYVQFDWDGDGKFFGTKVSGIRWGDKYHFKTVKMDGKNSSWDYTQPCTIPYMMLYKSDNLGNAELAMVQTQTWKQKPAGGYWWSSKNWGKTGKPMMENWNCTYQLNAYEGWESEKMAWGDPFGFVGVSKYDCLDFTTKGNGYPHQGYSVLGAGSPSCGPGATSAKRNGREGKQSGIAGAPRAFGTAESRTSRPTRLQRYRQWFAKGPSDVPGDRRRLAGERDSISGNRISSVASRAREESGREGKPRAP